ncbi:uncharacterized protein LACBIDRAFT_332384 [Laccaria bicolor S238N-H82]|uniref:Predicted protein n=1 Tax=Laccaria bicolor (strain S238N-H82 / ATCC MYA-4686) TaxID=486041 RepID=B0DSJ6_LACBS|nr:uncharacterized protein LACBIDRAFT_332384 [Laccaria bicolor S238N-H82]EDR02561.1 predicted protein [Laccaria bicolor S238N-H82]|eukprot:XP_001886924.1 predicted protein [Laccaria bicolor S238N-H82]
MAVIGIDVQDVKRLDGRIKITAKYPIAHGGYSDIYPGIWRGGSAFLGPGVWTGNATSGQNVAVGTAHIYIVLPPNSRTLSCIKVVIKVMRHADRDLKANDPITRSKYAKASIDGSLPPDLEKEYRVWAHLRHPNVLPFFGLIDDPAIPSMGVVTPRCTFGDLRCFFSDPTRASSANRLSIVKGIARGLTYIHGKRVVHGDLTMENVLIELINGVFTPLISDFGLSRVLETEAEKILLAEDENQSRKALTLGADVWCFDSNGEISILSFDRVSGSTDGGIEK